MKKLIFVLMIFNFSSNIDAQELIYDIEINDIKGASIDLHQFRGKYILFVNVASNCGFTNQYSDLQELYQQYKKNLIVIGLPCNQFEDKSQEMKRRLSNTVPKILILVSY